MNVKKTVKGWNLQNKYRNPLKLNEENYAFLTIFCNWLEFWDSIPGKSGKLTKETFTALHHTIYFRTYTILYWRIENGLYITWKISNWSSGGKIWPVSTT